MAISLSVILTKTFWFTSKIRNNVLSAGSHHLRQANFFQVLMYFSTSYLISVFLYCPLPRPFLFDGCTSELWDASRDIKTIWDF